MRSDVKQEWLSIQDQLLEQVRTITRIIESERFTAIGRREMTQSLVHLKERVEGLPFLARSSS